MNKFMFPISLNLMLFWCLYAQQKKIDCNHYEKTSHEIPCQPCILCLNTASDKVAGKVTSGMITSLKQVKTSD